MQKKYIERNARLVNSFVCAVQMFELNNKIHLVAQ